MSQKGWESGREDLEPLKSFVQSRALHCFADSSFCNELPHMWLNSTSVTQSLPESLQHYHGAVMRCMPWWLVLEERILWPRVDYPCNNNWLDSGEMDHVCHKVSRKFSPWHMTCSPVSCRAVSPESFQSQILEGNCHTKYVQQQSQMAVAHLQILRRPMPELSGWRWSALVFFLQT